MYQFSIVIPTYNRLEVLPEVLSALGQQVDSPEFEVIVIDDHSTDATPSFLSSVETEYDLTVLTNSGKGPASARNLGIERARGQRIAFLGDDTIPAPNWLREHQLGAAPNTAVLGFTEWHKEMKVTRFLSWLNECGKQFGYGLIQDGESVPFNFFYSSNLSASAEVLKEALFDTSFPYPAWEDIELGYRLVNKGELELRYRKSARTEHFHPTCIARFSMRQRKAGESAFILSQIHPELSAWLGCNSLPVSSRLHDALANILSLWCRAVPYGPPILWEWLLSYHYKMGILRAQKSLEEAQFTSPNPEE